MQAKGEIFPSVSFNLAFLKGSERAFASPEPYKVLSVPSSSKMKFTRIARRLVRVVRPQDLTTQGIGLWKILNGRRLEFPMGW